MKKSAVSVLMSVYNGEKYLREAIESVLNQTFTNFEFLVINDGSTDRSGLLLEEYQKQDKRLRVSSQENKGVTKATNNLLRHAQGDYIAIMDADDVALPMRFEKQVQFLEQNSEYVVVGSKVLIIDPDGLPIRPFSEKTSHEELDADHMAGKGGAIIHPASMIRRRALESVGGYRDMAPAQDFDLFLRLAEIGKLANLPDMLLKYRMHSKSLGNSKRLKQQREAKAAVMEAHIRRGLAPPANLILGNEHQASVSELHCKWAWWALGAGNVATARKHAFLALKKKPISLKNWKVVTFAIRGYKGK